jgi:hypothetical protein
VLVVEVEADASAAEPDARVLVERGEVGAVDQHPIRLCSVDLPEPLRPTSTAISPGVMATETSRRTIRSESPS